MSSEDSLRKFIREEIGRNFHTLDNTPHTFDDFQDYDIAIDGDIEGGYFLTIHYLDEKIFPTQKFNSKKMLFLIRDKYTTYTRTHVHTYIYSPIRACLCRVPSGSW